MASILVTFLGIGGGESDIGYDKASYNWQKGYVSPKVHFAQTAIIDALQRADSPLDKIICFTTQESHAKHFDALDNELKETLTRKCPEIISPPHLKISMEEGDLWLWFEQLLDAIDEGDELIFDFTHGFRSVPIIFSTAIGFLQRAKGVQIGHAFYASFDREQRVNPIIDLKDFFIVNQWAESVGRLVDDADTRNLAELASYQNIPGLAPLAEERLITALQAMTDSIRNVEINHIASKVHEALALVEEAKKTCEGSARLMLKLISDKFSALALEPPGIKDYNRDYFQNQLRVIGVFIEHRLFMQAFTAMREFIGSIGLIGLGKSSSINSNKGRKRRSYAEVFIRMLKVPDNKWDFPGDAKIQMQTLTPWYRQVSSLDNAQNIKEFTKDLIDIRNGFDHAWTINTISTTIEDQAGKAHKFLQNLVEELKQKQLLK